MNKKYLLIGLVIFYTIQLLSFHRIIYLSSYFFAVIFFYLSTKNITRSLFYTLFLSIFSDIGFAGSLFLIQPEELNLGSGYWITPMTVFMILLLPVTVFNGYKSISRSDILLLLFFLWSMIITLIFPNQNSLSGLVFLEEIIIVYFIYRELLKKDYLVDIRNILLSLLAFESILGLIQILLGRPIGLMIESSTYLNPYGLITPESDVLYRIIGTFAHPNNFAASLLAIIFFLIFMKKNKSLILLQIGSIIVLFFTYSRASWIFFLVLYLFSIRKELSGIISTGIYKINPKLILTIMISTVLFFFFLGDFFLTRLNTFSLAFRSGGSFDIREKLVEEGVSIISQFPLTGVGLNNAVGYYMDNSVSDILQYSNKAYPIHNLFLEIASECGIPALILFLLFIVSIYYFYSKSNRNYYKKAAIYGFSGLLLMSLVNPFFHISQFRLFFLLAGIILI